jgi:hypothetical protein
MSKERKLYPELMGVPPSSLRLEQLHTCLWDIASGTSCFGHMEEWEQWYRYLLPELIVRSHESYAFDFLLERNITAFMEVFWAGVNEEYPGFRQDVVDAQSLVLMRSEMWTSRPGEGGVPTESIPAFLVYDDEGNEALYGWDLDEAPGSVAAALCFGLKYLQVGEINSWVESLLQIEHPHWRAALLVWLRGARELLQEEVPRPQTLNRARPSIQWQESHILGVDNVPEPLVPAPGFNDPGLFLSSANTHEFWVAIRRHLTPEMLRKWEEGLWLDPLLGKQSRLADLVGAVSDAVAA